MKKILKNISVLGLAALALVGCEDMFTAENELVTSDLEPQDTLYQVMGIVQRMEKLMTRTVLFGEARADLVDINDYTSKDIRQLADNAVSLDNEYNNPTDYYAVINSCNIYLAYVDSLLTTHGERYFEKEIAAVKAYRAWTYLELAKIYGEVPFITEPVETSAFAEKVVSEYPKRGLEFICSYFIEDLKGYPYIAENNSMIPSYAGTYHNESYRKFFIPARVMLAELYLWRGSCTQNRQDFIEAIRMYHDFLSFANEEHPLGTDNVTWQDANFKNITDNYSNRFKYGKEQITAIPMDTIECYGHVTDLRAIFNSSYKNNYYAMLNPSQRIKEISREQKFCFYRYENSRADTLYAPDDVTKVEDAMEVGDLRLHSVYSIKSEKNLTHSEYNELRQKISKYNDVGNANNDERVFYVPLYRTTTLYLHMAEALNRAGFYETAFAVLKYGLDYGWNYQSYISNVELGELSTIVSYGIPSTYEGYSFLYWGDMNTTSQNYPFQVRRLNDPTFNQFDMMGVHSLGSGHSEVNKYYELPRNPEDWAEADAMYAVIDSIQEAFDEWYVDNPVPDDVNSDEYKAWYDEYEQEFNTPYKEAYEKYEELSNAAREKEKDVCQQFVTQKILDEEALEGMFEGQRFYDLMRQALFTGDKDYIANEVAKRKGVNGVCPAADNLRGGKWYLPLRSR
ncbi:MAG: RagB/SusD family nutrient uptake outer membrane protein [Bacteroidaceae bacterium]|nr:RagB/SusD family nutrient uptake outer membrane protein [Bacteroidaceae bacterium]